MTAETNKGPVLGMRHVQALLIFLNITTVFIGRLNVGVSVVAMTNAETTNPNFPEYDWTEAEKSYILSSFFWGYILTQFLGGYLCKRFGVKSVMFWGVFGSGVCSALTPLFIGFGEWQAYCGIRVLMGLAQGVVFPCIHQHLAKWSPPEERNRLGALSHTGIECGNVSAMFLSGMIAKSSLGWPGISYVSAGVAFFWCTLWFVFAANHPTESRFIGENELIYIESSLKHNESYHATIIPIPWKAIWTSAPFLALLIVRCAELGTEHSAGRDPILYERSPRHGHEEQCVLLGTPILGHVVHVVYLPSRSRCALGQGLGVLDDFEKDLQLHCLLDSCCHFGGHWLFGQGTKELRDCSDDHQCGRE
uniref:RE70413p n=1 Tax=Drosophila melanogaster TaxID=7227 RepID=Q8SZP8_DROME|nr:RE70413p [Drosophila melanogaster]